MGRWATGATVRRAVAAGSAVLLVLLPVGACRGGAGKGEAMAGNSEGDGKAVRKKVLDSPVAGSWYPGDPAGLRSEIEQMLAAADVGQDGRPGGRVLGLVSPHAGYRYSGAVAAHGFRMLRGQKVRRAIVLGPSHRVPFQGLALPDATHWRTPLGEVEIDGEAVAALARTPGFLVRPDAFEKEHSVDMQVPFLQVVAPGLKLVPIVVGRLDSGQEKEAGNALFGMLDEGTVLVASSDFTHYGQDFGYVPFREDVPRNLEALAATALAALGKRDVEAFRAHLRKTGDTICGQHPVAVLLEALPRTAEGVTLRFDTSGRMTGDWSHCVSYASVAFRASPPSLEFRGLDFLPADDRAFLLSLARETLRAHLAGRDLPDPEREGRAIPESVRRDHGVFVTLTQGGRLRGCIGSILPVEPLWKGVVHNAVNAAAHDPRFHPVLQDEEPSIDIEISVLTPPAEVRGPADIVVGRDGVLLSKGRDRAVFLPQVAPEQGWGLEETLSHLCLKAGLSADAWTSGARFEVFQAHVFHEASRRGKQP